MSIILLGLLREIIAKKVPLFMLPARRATSVERERVQPFLAPAVSFPPRYLRRHAPHAPRASIPARVRPHAPTFKKIAARKGF